MEMPIQKQSKGSDVSNNSPSRSRITQKESKTLFVVNNRQKNPSDEDIIDEFEQSNQQLRAPKAKNKSAPVEDYVDLPKINFQKAQSSSPGGKISEANSNSRLVEQASNREDDKENRPDQKSSKQSATELNERQLVESEHGEEWARWNVEKIKIIPSTKVEEEVLSLPIFEQNNRKEVKSRGNRQRELFREKQRLSREHNIRMVSNFLSGKASVMWLFILQGEINGRELDSIKDIYKDYVDNDYEVPLCRNYKEALRFLNLPQCFFKVVSDIDSAEQLLEDTPCNKSIVAIYIYSPRESANTTRVYELKRLSRKIKGIFLDLDTAASQAKDQIQNEAKFIRVGDELERDKNKLRFPSFIMLSDADKSDVTAYRLSLYGALKIKDSKQRGVYLKQFTDMVELRYADIEKELGYLQDYKRIDHLHESTEHKAKQILNFYVRETFYYALTNSILRLSRSAEQFRPCTIPFNETYHAIRHYYLKYLKQNKNSIKKMVTYRGAKLRNSDVKALHVDGYIELLGFTSTSLKKSQAQKFMDNDSYLIEIHIEKAAQSEEELLYDHGFVEINRYGLASEAFQNQQQVLFNALNVFKVIDLDLKSMVRKITLKYGAIFELMRAKPSSLSARDKAVMANYKYCTQTFDKIQDDGDVMLLAQEHDKCMEYYQTKIDEGDHSSKTFGKLANAQLESGDLNAAYENALRSLQIMDQKDLSEKMQRQMLKFASIFDYQEDHVHYQGSLARCMGMNNQDWLTKVRLIKARAEKRMREGQVKGCKEDLDICRETIAGKKNSFEARKKQIQSRYFLRSIFCCVCSTGASRQLEEQRDLELLKIEEEVVEFERRSEQIHLLCVEIENLSKELAEIVGDREMGQKSRIAAQEHFSHLSKQVGNSPIAAAKFQVLDATVHKANNMAEFEQSMESAIEKVKKCDPFHKDLGVYNKVLGKERLVHIKKKMQLAPLGKPSVVTEQHGQAQQKGQYVQLVEGLTVAKQSAEVEKYDYEQHQHMHGKCKGSFKEAANSVAYHKGSEHPEYIQLQNNISELDFDYSYLIESQKTARQNSLRKVARSHSQGAKCFLLLAKISLARGELKKSFSEVEQSFSILRSALVKVDNKEYNKVLMNSPTYMDINLHKVKVFNRQLRHDLALRELKIIKKVAKIKIDNEYNSSLLATIYEEQAQVLVCLGETEDFEKYLLRAIEIREREMGQYNIQNAVCYSNLFKHLRNLNDLTEAMNYHHKASEIFSRFSADHPNSWIIHFSNGLIFYSKQEYEQAISHLEYCLKVAVLRYSPNHISVLKIQFQYGKLLKNMNKRQLALKIFEELEKTLNKAENSSKAERQIDDERISIRLHLLRQLKQLYDNGGEPQAMKSMLAKQRCEKQLKILDHMLGSQMHLSPKP